MVRIAAIGLLPIVAGCGPAANEGLRAKMAAGCQTEVDCSAIVVEARSLKRQCSENRVLGVYDCAQAQNDLEQAQALASAERTARVDRYLGEQKIRRAAQAAESERIKRTREEAFAAAEAERARKADAEKTERESQERAARAERCATVIAARAQRDEQRRQHEERRKAQADAIEWVVKHCPIVRDPIYETKEWVDANGFVKRANVIADWEEFYRCPASMPADAKAAAPVFVDAKGRILMEPVYAGPPQPAPATASGAGAKMLMNDLQRRRDEEYERCKATVAEPAPSP